MGRDWPVNRAKHVSSSNQLDLILGEAADEIIVFIWSLIKSIEAVCVCSLEGIIAFGLGNGERQFQPGKPYTSMHMGHTVSTRCVIENS